LTEFSLDDIQNTIKFTAAVSSCSWLDRLGISFRFAELVNLIAHLGAKRTDNEAYA
jgi:hypothetical protein